MNQIAEFGGALMGFCEGKEGNGEGEEKEKEKEKEKQKQKQKEKHKETEIEKEESSNTKIPSLTPPPSSSPLDQTLIHIWKMNLVALSLQFSHALLSRGFSVDYSLRTMPSSFGTFLEFPFSSLLSPPEQEYYSSLCVLRGNEKEWLVGRGEIRGGGTGKGKGKERFRAIWGGEWGEEEKGGLMDRYCQTLFSSPSSPASPPHQQIARLSFSSLLLYFISFSLSIGKSNASLIYLNLQSNLPKIASLPYPHPHQRSFLFQFLMACTPVTSNDFRLFFTEGMPLSFLVTTSLNASVFSTTRNFQQKCIQRDGPTTVYDLHLFQRHFSSICPTWLIAGLIHHMIQRNDRNDLRKLSSIFPQVVGCAPSEVACGLFYFIFFIYLFLIQFYFLIFNFISFISFLSFFRERPESMDR